MQERQIEKSGESCVFYGIPKVEYSHKECTPFPSTLKACLNYMGQEIDYGFLLAASGAAFRLRWNRKCWDGGNVDVVFLYQDPMEVFRRSFRMVGRSCNILSRNERTKKEDFMAFLKEEIDEGRPVIALGIIGPPEAGIVSGYRENGNVLMGWNFFQENPEFAGDVGIDESGYFVCDKWWENSDTVALMSIGEHQEGEPDVKEMLENAVDILRQEKIGDHAGGAAAFDTWAGAMSDESQFPPDAELPLLFERLMCQNDAIVMIGEGRSYAASFLEGIGTSHPQVKAEAKNVAELFRREAQCAHRMAEAVGGFQNNEDHARTLAKKEVRRKIVELILQAKELDRQAAEGIESIIQKM